MCDQEGHLEDHPGGGAVLPELSVDPGPYPQIGDIAHLVGSDHPRSDRARAVEVLARTVLGAAMLPFAHRALVHDRVAGDVIHRPFLGDVTAGLADDDAELALEIELVGDTRLQDRRAVRGEARRETREHARPFGSAVFQHLVISAVVPPDAKDLLGRRDGKHELDLVETEIRIPARLDLDPGQCEAGDRALQRRVLLADACAEIDDAAVRHDAVAFPALAAVADQFHLRTPFVMRRRGYARRPSRQS